MPASQTGFGSFFLDRNVAMAAGYQIPLLGCSPGAQQQQQQQHLAAMAAGVPITYSGLQGYNFIPYPQHRHMAHMSAGFDLKAASPYHPHPHHPALLARGAAAFYPSYRPGAAEDPGRVAKVTTRESTGALKAWLNEHLKNPYPTKGEKIMLAIITKMSLTQVSTWFANARRRLKKENRVSWASKGKSDEEDEGPDADSDEDDEEEEEEEVDDNDDEGSVRKCDAGAQAERAADAESRAPADARLEAPQRSGDAELQLVKDAGKGGESEQTTSAPERKDSCHKPKIWSLAETATSEPARKPADNIYHSAGKLWADWAARNGLLVPAGYATHEIL